MASADTPEKDPAILRPNPIHSFDSDGSLTGALIAGNGIQSIPCRPNMLSLVGIFLMTD